jgi:DNA-binding response OmpR family regulator
MQAQHSRSLLGRSILIIEDEPLIALDVYSALSAVGASIIAATDLADAEHLARSAEISAGVLDINFGGRDCSTVCEVLSHRRVPFLFLTGFQPAPIMMSWPKAPVVAKPASHEQLVAAVADLLHGTR